MKDQGQSNSKNLDNKNVRYHQIQAHQMIDKGLKMCSQQFKRLFTENHLPHLMKISQFQKLQHQNRKSEKPLLLPPQKLKNNLKSNQLQLSSLENHLLTQIPLIKRKLQFHSQKSNLKKVTAVAAVVVLLGKKYKANLSKNLKPKIEILLLRQKRKQ